MATISTPVIDTTTLGNWVGVYGSLGQQYVAGTLAVGIIHGEWPAGWGFSTNGELYNGYTGTDGPPAFLQNPDDPTHRAAGGWYGTGPMTFIITPPDGGTYKLSWYDCYEESGIHREYGVEWIDDATGEVLQSIESGFHYYVWHSVEFGGAVRVRFVSSNPIVSGFFLDPAGGGGEPDGRLCGSGQGDGLQS